jgi:Uma2 family endonuclease
MVQRGSARYIRRMTVPVTRSAEGLPRRAFTIADVERMVEAGIIASDERLEILGGEIVPMSPKGNRHERIKVALNLRWGRVRPDGFKFAPETALRLDQLTYLEPDFIVFSAGVPLGSVTGPDVLLAVEVADSSLDYDLHRKPLIYAGFGVHELWVIDVARNCTHLHHAASPGGYAEISIHGADERLEPVRAPAAFGFKLADLARD